MFRGKLGAAPRGRGRLIIRGAVASSVITLVALTAYAPIASAHRTRVTPAAAQGRPYRQGVVPLRGHQAGSASSTGNLSYGGGLSGVGVTTGSPQVYLIFWGSQWGTLGTDGQGNLTFSGDPKGIAPYVQRFIKGLGTGPDANSGASTWSGVMTQYCESSSMLAGAMSCSSGASQVGYPGGQSDGGALAGVWVDESAAAPSQASGNQIGAEAVKAATKFGNTTQASNRNTQYVIVSPTGTHPDGFNTFFGQFCAWHDYTGDGTLSGGAVASTDGQLAFTNLPYVTDMGTSCGQNFVNSNGTLDGVSIVEGHEYAETITDQFPAGGWTDSAGNENGDKCAWISSGQGASQNISLGTGTFAVQSTWANDFNGGSGGCEVSHPVISSGGGGSSAVTVKNPGSQTGTVGTGANLQITATDSGGGTLTYTASGLPAGLSIDPNSGLISGTPTTIGTSNVIVVATDSTGPSGSTSFTWTINNGNDFSISASPSSVSVRRGGSATSSISAAITSGSAQSVTLSASGLPAGATAGFSPTSITSGGSSSTLTIATSSTTPAGTYSINVTGTGTSAIHSTKVTLTVRKH